MMVFVSYSCKRNVGIEGFENPQQYSNIYMPKAHGQKPTKYSILISDTTYTFQYNAFLGGVLLPKMI